MLCAPCVACHDWSHSLRGSKGRGDPQVEPTRKWLSKVAVHSASAGGPPLPLALPLPAMGARRWMAVINLNFILKAGGGLSGSCLHRARQCPSEVPPQPAERPSQLDVRVPCVVPGGQHPSSKLSLQLTITRVRDVVVDQHWHLPCQWLVPGCQSRGLWAPIATTSGRLKIRVEEGRP